MIAQGWPMFAAGTSGDRTGKLYSVIGWQPHHEASPDLGLVPVLVPIDGGGVAQKYDVEKGIARLYPTFEQARNAASTALDNRRPAEMRTR
jgi:hypothetical protein